MSASTIGPCDVPGCSRPWLLVQLDKGKPVRRRCRHHWFTEREAEPHLQLVPQVQPTERGQS